MLITPRSWVQPSHGPIKKFLFLLINILFNAILAAQIKLSFSILTSWFVFTYIRATYSTSLTLRTQQWCPREDKTKLQDCEIIDYLDQKFSYFTIAGPLAQSAERGADNAKVVSSTLTRTKEKFFFYLNFFFAQSHSLTSWSVFIYIKNHLVYKHERRHCFVTSKYNDLYERSFLKTISFMKKVSSIKMIIISEKKKIVSVTSAIGYEGI